MSDQGQPDGVDGMEPEHSGSEPKAHEEITPAPLEEDVRLLNVLGLLLMAGLIILSGPAIYLLYEMVTGLTEPRRAEVMPGAWKQGWEEDWPLVGVFVLPAVLTLLLECFWIHRAYRMAQELGAQEMRFTPFEAMACRFVPFANLYMPCQAVRDLLKAARNPAEWEIQPTGPLPILWWISVLTYPTLLWLMSITFDEPWRMRHSSEEAARIKLKIVAVAIWLAICLMELALVWMIHRALLSRAANLKSPER